MKGKENKNKYGNKAPHLQMIPKSPRPSIFHPNSHFLILLLSTLVNDIKGKGG
jgi:hypothetical protein